jgi:hypothetical protein
MGDANDPATAAAAATVAAAAPAVAGSNAIRRPFWQAPSPPPMPLPQHIFRLYAAAGKANQAAADAIANLRNLVSTVKTSRELHNALFSQVEQLKTGGEDVEIPSDLSNRLLSAADDVHISEAGLKQLFIETRTSISRAYDAADTADISLIVSLLAARHQHVTAVTASWLSSLRTAATVAANGLGDKPVSTIPGLCSGSPLLFQTLVHPYSGKIVPTFGLSLPALPQIYGYGPDSIACERVHRIWEASRSCAMRVSAVATIPLQYSPVAMAACGLHLRHRHKDGASDGAAAKAATDDKTGASSNLRSRRGSSFSASQFPGIDSLVNGSAAAPDVSRFALTGGAGSAAQSEQTVRFNALQRLVGWDVDHLPPDYYGTGASLVHNSNSFDSAAGAGTTSLSQESGGVSGSDLPAAAPPTTASSPQWHSLYTTLSPMWSLPPRLQKLLRLAGSLCYDEKEEEALGIARTSSRQRPSTRMKSGHVSVTLPFLRKFSRELRRHFGKTADAWQPWVLPGMPQYTAAAAAAGSTGSAVSDQELMEAAARVGVKVVVPGGNESLTLPIASSPALRIDLGASKSVSSASSTTPLACLTGVLPGYAPFELSGIPADESATKPTERQVVDRKKGVVRASSAEEAEAVAAQQLMSTSEMTDEPWTHILLPPPPFPSQHLLIAADVRRTFGDVESALKAAANSNSTLQAAAAAVAANSSAAAATATAASNSGVVPPFANGRSSRRNSAASLQSYTAGESGASTDDEVVVGPKRGVLVRSVSAPDADTAPLMAVASSAPVALPPHALLSATIPWETTATSATSSSTGGSGAMASYTTLAVMRHRLSVILLAYAAYDRDVGYCQGMNFLASNLIRHMPTEHGWWTLAALIHSPKYRLAEMFATGLTRVGLSFFSLAKLLTHHAPMLAGHMLREGVVPGK